MHVQQAEKWTEILKVISHSEYDRGERDSHLPSNMNTLIETNMHKSDEKNLAVKVCMFVLKKSKYVKTLKGFLSRRAERQVVLRFTVLFCMQSLDAMLSLSNFSLPWD